MMLSLMTLSQNDNKITQTIKIVGGMTFSNMALIKNTQHNDTL